MPATADVQAALGGAALLANVERGSQKAPTVQPYSQMLDSGVNGLKIGVEGLTQTMMWGDGYGQSRSDLYAVSLMDFHRGWRQRANELSETTKLFLMLGTYINGARGSQYYGKAINIARRR